MEVPAQRWQFRPSTCSPEGVIHGTLHPAPVRARAAHSRSLLHLAMVWRARRPSQAKYWPNRRLNPPIKTREGDEPLHTCSPRRSAGAGSELVVNLAPSGIPRRAGHQAVQCRTGAGCPGSEDAARYEAVRPENGDRGAGSSRWTLSAMYDHLVPARGCRGRFPGGTPRVRPAAKLCTQSGNGIPGGGRGARLGGGGHGDPLERTCQGHPRRRTASSRWSVPATSASSKESERRDVHRGRRGQPSSSPQRGDA